MMKPAVIGKALAVDLDGTIISFDWKTYQGVRHFGEVDQDMVKALKRAQAAGWHVIIHSCRMTPIVYEAEGLTADDALHNLHRFLYESEIPYNEIWVGPGKPVARLYVDDRGIGPEEFKGGFKCQS